MSTEPSKRIRGTELETLSAPGDRQVDISQRGQKFMDAPEHLRPLSYRRKSVCRCSRVVCVLLSLAET